MSRDPARPPMLPRLVAMAGAVVLFAATVPTAAPARPEHVRIDTRHDVAANADGIVVRFHDGTTGAQRRAVATAHGLVRVRGSGSGRTVAYGTGDRVTAAVRSALAGDPSVAFVAPNYRRVLTADPIDEPGFSSLWGLDNHGQTVGPLGSQSTGATDVDVDGLQALGVILGDPSVVVAVIDDGVDFGHPDLIDRAWTNPGESGADGLGGQRETNGIDDDENGFIDDVHGWDFCNDDATVHDPGRDGHGTHVAGTIAASLDGQGVVGVAPGVSIMALKFIDSVTACGSDDMAIAAIEYAGSFGVRIANASWGGDGYSPVLDAAIGASGMLFVAAAGNGDPYTDVGYDLGTRSFHPAGSDLPNVLTVAAATPSGTLATFSNYSKTKVDIAAPGVNILSAYPAVPGICSVCWAWSDGTSMAAPHVSGIAALIGSMDPDLLADPVALRARILATGKPLAATHSRTATGAIADAWRALDQTAPAAAAPDTHRFGVGTKVGRSFARVTVGWPAATDDMTGVATYAVDVRTGSGSWATADPASAARSILRKLTFRTDYRFRIGARDASGNASAPVEGPTVTTRIAQESGRRVTYGGSWRVAAASGASGSKTRYATRSGASVSFTFTGRAVAIVAPKGPTQGKARVYVDGVFAERIDLYRSSTRHRLVVHESHWATVGTHTIRLVVSGTKSRPRVDIDGFAVLR